MPWVKLESGRALHRKLRAAGFAARGLDEAAMCQVAEDGTDGFLSDDTLMVLGVAHKERNVKRLADILVENGRWQRDEERCGYVIHGYLERNPSAAEWRELVAKRQASGKAGAKAKAQANGSASASASAKASPPADCAQQVPKPFTSSLRESEDEDVNVEEKISAALLAIADRRRARLPRQPESVGAWTTAVVDSLRRSNASKLAEVRPDWSLERIAAHLEPPKPERNEPAGGARIPQPRGCGSCADGWIDEDDGTVSPCPSCSTRRSA